MNEAPVPPRAADTERGAVPLPSSVKAFHGGTERTATPDETLARIRPLLARFGITRVANITGLDRIGMPVFAVHRPNARSLSVSQGKGATPEEAEISGVMESIESYHAEHVAAPLLLGSQRDLHGRHRLVDVAGLPRLSVGRFHSDLPILWTPATDLVSEAPLLVPYEMVHLDFRLPLPAGSGCFVMGSNGLASGNDPFEALSHAVCEVVERDANTLWHLSGPAARHQRLVDLSSIDDDRCRAALARFDAAGLLAAVWETTSDVGIASYLCTVVDRDRNDLWPMPPVSGSGCHPRRRIALLRALTEAAQGRLTVISGARDDLSGGWFDPAQAYARAEQARQELAQTVPRRPFGDAPDHAHPTIDGDLRWELERLVEAGCHQVVAVDLTKQDIGIPVMRVIVPYLETISELAGYVPGRRARHAMRRGQA